MNDGCGSETASEEFDEIHDEQRGQYDKDGEKRIRYEDYIEFDVEARGVEHASITKQTECGKPRQTRSLGKRDRSVAEPGVENASTKKARGGGALLASASTPRKSDDEIAPEDSVSQVGAPEEKPQRRGKVSAAVARTNLPDIPCADLTDRQLMMRKDDLHSRLGVIVEPFVVARASQAPSRRSRPR